MKATRCPRCRSPFPSRASMVDHLQRCRAWLDDAGVAYDWSFSCSVCGLVYVRDGNGHHPGFAVIDVVLLAHLAEKHPDEEAPKVTATL